MRVRVLFFAIFENSDHSWYLTLYSSFVTSFVGLYLFYHVCHDGFTATIDNETDLTRYAAIFFIGYQARIMDLFIGSLHYENLITYDDGWVHHFLYIVVCAYLLHDGLTSLFAIALVEELPIVLLAFHEVQKHAETEPVVWRFVLSHARRVPHCVDLQRLRSSRTWSSSSV